MSGGIWLLWNKSRVNIIFLNYSQHNIHGIVNEGMNDLWMFTVVYANPNVILKKQCFNEVVQLTSNIRKPCMVIGDFNEILMATEKIEGAEVDHHRITWFAKWV